MLHQTSHRISVQLVEPTTELTQQWSQRTAAAHTDFPRPGCIKEKGEAQKFGACYYGDFGVCWGFWTVDFVGTFFQYSDKKISLGFFLSRCIDFFGLGRLEDVGSHGIPQQTNAEVEPDDEQIFLFLLS